MRCDGLAVSVRDTGLGITTIRLLAKIKPQPSKTKEAPQNCFSHQAIETRIGYNISKTNPRIVNIVENKILVCYNAERF